MQTEITRKLLYDLSEREKELNCLYLIEDILQDYHADLAEIFQNVVNTIPFGWQFPDICVAKIDYEGQMIRSAQYKRTRWRMSEVIKINSRIAGELHVIYLESDKIDKQNPFIENEKKLLKSIIKQLSNYIFHRHLLETFGAWTKAKETLEILEEKESAILQILKNADINEVKQFLKNPPKPISNQEELSIILEPHSPKHWKWRKKMVEKIAQSLDAERFGVKAIYYFGSTKNATAGPASDIDLLLYIKANEQQKKDLTLWLEGWSKCLSVINELKTGYATNGLLDAHFITDEDIRIHSSFAMKIGAATDGARLVKKYSDS
jgi:predicted nucleotidyltransferase